MSKENKGIKDALASLVLNEAELSKTGRLILTLETPALRDAFARAINARCDVASMARLLMTFIEHVPNDKLENAVKVFSLSNGSSLVQRLEKGFNVPPSGKAVVEIETGGLGY